MGEIVNLRQARKRVARLDKERLAEQNRALRGRTLAEKNRDRDFAQRTSAFVDGHKRLAPDGRDPS